MKQVNYMYKWIGNLSFWMIPVYIKIKLEQNENVKKSKQPSIDAPPSSRIPQFFGLKVLLA